MAHTIGLSGTRDQTAHKALAQTPLFRDLSVTALAELAGVARQRIYARRDLIPTRRTFPGDGSIVIIAQGSASLYHAASAGREILLDIVGTGDVFGFALFQARALAERTVAYHLPRRHVERLILAYPRVSLTLAELVAERAARMGERMAELAFYGVRTRLARTLVRLATTEAQHLVVATHAELAAMIGVRPEEVTKGLREFREAGLITQLRHGVIQVCNRAGLAAR